MTAREAAAQSANRPAGDEIAEMFRRMVVVRRVEERLGDLQKQGLTRGPIHRCDGQEAVGIGATAVLRPADTVTSTHRGHAHYIGKGLDTRRMVAEILGRATGSCGGRAGHMLVADAAQGLVGGNAIVGAGIPIAIGQALAHARLRPGTVALSFFGDGAAQTGICHEAMNMAGLWKLPAVFLCEHNGYGLTVHARHQSAIEDLAERAPGYAMPGEIVDGNDVVAVYRATAAAVARARAGEGPTLIEAKTYRMAGFSTSDMGGYQPAVEIESWRPRDPIQRARVLVVGERGEAAATALEAAAEREVTTAFELALSDPLPDAAEAAAPEYVVLAGGRA